jgi:hypothetical protein
MDIASLLSWHPSPSTENVEREEVERVDVWVAYPSLLKIVLNKTPLGGTVRSIDGLFVDICCKIAHSYA